MKINEICSHHARFIARFTWDYDIIPIYTWICFRNPQKTQQLPGFPLGKKYRLSSTNPGMKGITPDRSDVGPRNNGGMSGMVNGDSTHKK